MTIMCYNETIKFLFKQPLLCYTWSTSAALISIKVKEFLSVNGNDSSLDTGGQSGIIS